LNCSKCQKPAEPAHRVYEANLCDVCLRDWHLEQRRILPEAFLIWLPRSATEPVVKCSCPMLCMALPGDVCQRGGAS
jgi:hypothetical protein